MCQSILFLFKNCPKRGITKLTRKKQPGCPGCFLCVGFISRRTAYWSAGSFVFRSNRFTKNMKRIKDTATDPALTANKAW